MMTSFFTLAFALTLTVGLISCGTDEGADTAGDTTAVNDGAVPADTAARDTAATGADDGAVREYTFHGTVKKIDAGTQMITIDHEKIGDYMDAMTMPFKVADPAILDQVKVGDSTHFTLRVAGDQALITKVQSEHEGGQEH